APRELDLLAIAPIGEVPLGELILEPVERDRAFEHPDGDDHHDVLRPVHAQPGRVDRRHTFAVGHFFLRGGPSLRLGQTLRIIREINPSFALQNAYRPLAVAATDNRPLILNYKRRGIEHALIYVNG